MKKAILIFAGVAVVGTGLFFGIRWYNVHTAKYDLQVTVADWNSKTAQYTVTRNGKTESSGSATLSGSGGSGSGNGNYEIRIVREHNSLGFLLFVRGKQIAMRVVNFDTQTIMDHGN